MEIIPDFLTLGQMHGRTGVKNKPDKIVIHYTGSPNGEAKAVRGFFENGADGNYTSCHYIVGLKGEVRQLIPENEYAGHAGRAYGKIWERMSRTNNISSIGIEVCFPAHEVGADFGKFSEPTTLALIELVVDIMKRNNIPLERVLRHYDVCGKECPLYYVRNLEAWIALKIRINDASRIRSIKMQVETELFNVNGININGRNYLGARELLEHMDYKIDWKDETVIAKKT